MPKPLYLILNWLVSVRLPPVTVTLPGFGMILIPLAAVAVSVAMILFPSGFPITGVMVDPLTTADTRLASKVLPVVAPGATSYITQK